MRKYIIILIGILLVAASCNKSGNSPDKQEDILMSDKDSCAGYRVFNNKVYYLDEQILGADPSSFQCIKYEYSKDYKYVFFSKKKIIGCDPKTFTVLKHGYSKDKNYVYYDFYSGKKIHAADAKTFEVFDLSITKDKNFVYRFDMDKIEKIKGVDAKSFRRYKDKDYYVDNTYLYAITGDKIARLDTLDIESALDGQ